MIVSCRERKYENVRVFVNASKNIDQRDDVISLFAHTSLCVWGGEEFGRINVGTIVFTLTLIETKPRTKNGTNYLKKHSTLAS